MNQEARIASLETALTDLRDAFAETARIHQELAGQARVFEAAVLALIASHPRPDLLGPHLARHLSRVEAGAVGAAETEEHVQGVQDAQAVLMLALSESNERYRTQNK